MPEIIWNDSLLTGIKVIDNQHKHLVAITNRLYHAYEAKKEHEILAEIVTGLCDYSNEHFSTEEKLMKEYGYTEHGGHIAEHREFVEKTLDFLLDSLNNKQNLSEEMMNYLTNWWITHISGTDQRFGAFLKSKGIS